MARSIEEIKNEMTDAFMADETLHLQYGFDQSKSFSEQFSKVSLENIILYIVASAIWVLEVLFDKHQEEVSDTIAKRAHTLRWYREKAFAFQYGYDLSEDVAEYDNEGLTEDEIEKSRIVSKCSCESVSSVFPTIRVKAVTSNGAMTQDQFSAFEAYMKEIADAGVKLSVVSKDPDTLGLSMTVLYDPLIMNDKGELYNGGDARTFADYVNKYLESLAFNGEFYPNKLESYLMNCPGVAVARVDKAFVRPSGGSLIDITGLIKYSPTSGAFIFSNNISPNLSITFKQVDDE